MLLLLKNGGRRWELIAQAIRNVGNELDEETDNIVGLLGHADADVRKGAAIAASLCFPKRRESAITRLLNDDSVEIRGCASLGLSVKDGDILQNVVALQQSGDQHLREWAKAKLEGRIPGVVLESRQFRERRRD